MSLPTVECNFAIDAGGAFRGAISSAGDWARVHASRERTGFVAVGARTWNADGSRLLVSAEKLGREPVRQSVPVVFARRTALRAPTQSQVLPIVVAEAPPGWPCRFVRGRCLREGLAGLAARGVTSLFVEGGQRLHEAFVSCQLAARFTVYVASESPEVVRRAVERALPFLPTPSSAHRFAGGTLLDFMNPREAPASAA